MPHLIDVAVIAAVVSIVAALLLSAMPYGSGLLLAAGLAMAAGAGAEVVLERRAAR